MLLSALFLTVAARAEEPKIVWSASSTAESAEGRTFDVANLGDNKQGTFWAEGESGAGLGSWVQADFGKVKTLSSIKVWGSSWYNAEFFGHYARPKTLVVEYGDGSTEEFTTADGQVPQLLKLKSPKSTQTVKIRVKGVYSGKGVDTALSEVQFGFQPHEGNVAVASVKASSTAAADADGVYDAGNVADGLSDSLWCEGNAKSDGTGEWLELTLASSSTVSTLKFSVGSSDKDLFKKVNRPTKANVTFGDGSTTEVSLADFPFPQAKAVGSHTTDKIRIEFTGVKKGEAFDDVCVSEIAVVP